MGVLFLLFFVLVAHASSSAYSTQVPHGSRLLILYLSGLRWDYLRYSDEIGDLRYPGCHLSRVKPFFPSNHQGDVYSLFAGVSLRHVDEYNFNLTSHQLLWNEALDRGKNVDLYHFPLCTNQSLSLDSKPTAFNCIPKRDLPRPSLVSTLNDILATFTNRSTDLVAIYDDEIASITRLHGPSPSGFNLAQKMHDIDTAISSVIRYLKAHSDLNINFAVVGDHGVTDFKGYLALDRPFKWRSILKAVNYGTVVALWPNSESLDMLSGGLNSSTHFRVYTPESISNVSWGSMISSPPPLLLVAELGYVFQSNHINPVPFPENQLGVHGYPPNVLDMQTTFYAYGPAFKLDCHKFAKIDVYTYNLLPMLRNALFGIAEYPEVMLPLRESWTIKPLTGVVIGVCALVILIGGLLVLSLRMYHIKEENSPKLLVNDEPYLSDTDEVKT